jgi:hypothetical protein
LQLPWLLLWLVGEHALGAAIAGVMTGAIAGFAAWRPRPPGPVAPHFGGAHSALRGVYLRALRRRASDALVRGAGLAILAGAAAGLFVRNNHLADHAAGVLAASVISVVLVPGWAGLLLPLLDVHRASAWLATSQGITEAQRLAVLGTAVALVYAVTSLLAIAAASLLVFDPAIVMMTLAAGLAQSIAVTYTLRWADRAPTATAARAVIGAILAAGGAVLTLGLV